MKTSFIKGLDTEIQASVFLQKKGFVLLEHRYKTPYGEIDLIMSDADTIVAIEVKFRKNMEDCHYSISDRQKSRIQDALIHYVQQKDKNTSLLRCDVVLISPLCEIIHYENAW